MHRYLSVGVFFISLIGLPGIVKAQNSVTLYGLIDSGLTYVSNAGGKSNFLANDSIIQPSRFGLRGSEDLGGNNRLIFVLENGFSLNTGALAQPGLIFGRQAFIGLSNSRLGSVSLGRQYDFVWDYITIFSMGSRIGAFGFHPGDYDHLAGTLRINNAIKYTVEPIGGLSLGALYAFGGQPASASNGRAVAAGARYTGGIFSVAFAYNNVHDMPLNPPAQIATTLGSSFPPGAFVASNMQNIEAAASVTFGPSSTRALFTATTIAASGSSATMRTYELSEVFQFTPALVGSAGFSYSRMSPAKWRTASAILDYSLSKRTDVYIATAYQSASGGARAAFLAIPASSNGNEVVVRVGIRTFF